MASRIVPPRAAILSSHHFHQFNEVLRSSAPASLKAKMFELFYGLTLALIGTAPESAKVRLTRRFARLVEIAHQEVVHE